jgi:sugar O-acyltransferase (sialic acid O-acetyltransferase NeuD family)
MKETKKSLYLLGAGDLGREMESWLELLPDFHKEWEIRGFLDQNPGALNGFPSEFSITGDPMNFDFNSNDYVLMCITDPASKQVLAEKLRNRVNFFRYIAPDATISKFVNLGEGVNICLRASISTNAKIGDLAFINAGTHIGHDCRIGAYCSLMPNVDIGGDVVIGERVYIGANATILPGRIVGDDITIGAGSIVIRDLKQKGTYFGNPAKFISYKGLNPNKNSRYDKY